MEKSATAKYVRITPRKVGQVLSLIRGQRVEAAQQILMFTPKNAARVIAKVLKSAIANAQNAEDRVDVDNLVVREAVVGAGPTLKRWLPRAQGRATPILKRTCHITVVVGDPKRR